MRGRLAVGIAVMLIGWTVLLPAAPAKDLTRTERVYVYRLIDRLGDKEIDPQVLTEAIGILSKLGPKVLPVVRSRLGTDDVILRERLCAVLIQCLRDNEECPQVTPILKKQLIESLDRYGRFMKTAAHHLGLAERAEKSAGEEAAKPEKGPKKHFSIGGLKTRTDTRDDGKIGKYLKKAQEEREAATRAIDRGYWCGRTVRLICDYFETRGDEDDIDFFRKLALETVEGKYLPGRRVGPGEGPDVWTTVGRPWHVLRALVKRCKKTSTLTKCQAALVSALEGLDKKPTGRWYARLAVKDYRLTDHTLIQRLRELRERN